MSLASSLSSNSHVAELGPLLRIAEERHDATPRQLHVNTLPRPRQKPSMAIHVVNTYHRWGIRVARTKSPRRIGVDGPQHRRIHQAESCIGLFST